MKTDAFAFANFAGEMPGLKVTTPFLVRMFGADKVCKPDSNPCELTDVAAGWLDSANSTLSAGRSEGFAVMSQLFFLKQLDPKDFGADTVAGLRFDGNTKLQNELAYWAITQRVPAVLSGDKKFQAKDVMPFLAEALKPGAKESWRLALAMKTDTSFKGGHAFSPIGFYRGEKEGQYFIRVYDPNLPVREGRIEVNTKDNTWSYQGSADPDADPRLYAGNSDNKNLMYFSPVTKRTGTLPCPFEDGAVTNTITTTGDIAAVVETDDRRLIGIQGGQVLEPDGGRVVPSFSACDCSLPQSILNTYVDNTKTNNISIGGTGTGTTDGGVVNVTGPNLSVTVKGVNSNPSNPDSMTVSDLNKKVTYKTASDTPVEMTSTFSSFGSTTTVSVKVNGDSSAVVLDATDNKNVKVGTAGAPAGTTVEVTVTTVTNGKKTTSTTTYTTKSTDSQVTVDTTTGTAMTDLNATLDHCVNGKQDYISGQSWKSEADIDCGGTDCVAKCAAGKRCASSDDNCTSGLICAPMPDDAGLPTWDNKRCRTPGCDDGVLNGSETGRDCGGPTCAKCIGGYVREAYNGCNTNSDCESNFCRAVSPYGGPPTKLCIDKGTVQARIERLPVGALLYLNTDFDGVRSSQVVVGKGGTATAPQYEVLGTAYAYSVTVGTGDGGTTGCQLVSGGSLPDGGTWYYDYNQSMALIRCPAPASGELFVHAPAYGEILGVSNFGVYDTANGCESSLRPLDFKLTNQAGTVTTVNAVTTGNIRIGTLGRFNGAPETFTLAITTPQPDRWDYFSNYQNGTAYVQHSTRTCGFGSSSTPTYNGTWDQQFSSYLNIKCSCSYTYETVDAGRPDSGVDAGRDAGFDAGFDAGIDAGRDAGFDAGVDAGPTTNLPVGSICTTDSQCLSNDCECGLNSGSCTGNTGRCGALTAVISTPTDGGGPSGTFTVPANCPSVRIHAWGAAGGSGRVTIPFPMDWQGGAGAFVGGTMLVSSGDVFTAWVGNVGGQAYMATGTQSVGSNLGTPANGGQGGVDVQQGSGGMGGGLTSVRRTGSATTSFAVPAGGGGTSNGMYGGGSVGHSGGAATNTGGDATLNQLGGGGGAGLPGGLGGSGGQPGNGGAFGSMPSGLTATPTDSASEMQTPNRTINDYYRCPTGAGEAGLGSNGNGCIVFRCVSP